MARDDRGEDNRAMATTPDISVVIGTFNRAAVLRTALASLAWQRTDGQFEYEIIVVDNGSTDGTPHVIAEAEAGRAVSVRGYKELEPGVAAARNRAIREATGRWIAFHDDDQAADPRWLIELLNLANEKACHVVGGDVKLRFAEENHRKLSPICRRLLGEMVGMDRVRRFNRKLVPGTNNMMIARQVFDEVGVFDEAILDGGEDADLYRRIRTAGYECWFTPQAIVHHIIPPERLEDAYMRWTSLRQGGHVALRERHDWGAAVLPLVATARAVQALMGYLPRYCLARLMQKPEAALG